jgi:hypothetical protein
MSLTFKKEGKEKEQPTFKPYHIKKYYKFFMKKRLGRKIRAL